MEPQLEALQQENIRLREQVRLRPKSRVVQLQRS